MAKTGYADYDRREELFEEYAALDLDGTDFSWFLVRKLIDAEERASHHAQIASVCSTTAERYAAALDSILEEIPNPSLPVTKEIARIAKEARKEAE